MSEIKTERRLGFMSRNDRILIASAKGGVGKSTTALGLALAYAEMGKSVLLADCDAASRSLDLLCGSDSSVLYNLGDIILGRVEPEDAVSSPFEAYPDIAFCAAPYLFQDEEAVLKTGKHLSDLMGDAVRRLMERVPRDIVIIDTSSGGGVSCAMGLLGEITTVLITAEQSKTSIRAAEYTASQMEKIGIENGYPMNQRLIVCSFDVASAMKGRRAGVIEMIDRSTLKCAGVVPFDDRLVLRQENGLLPDGKCISMEAYRNIAHRLSGDNVPLFTGIRRYEKKRSRIL
ncbi:MAG: septum site-determining protein MinD [Ruminococcaceae bacterium]|nr:septum site-determining protein MinD [Oscillospiraceae bacterium]